MFLDFHILNIFKSKKKQALRKFNYSLHGIQVLTYSDLVQCGQKIIGMYSQKNG